MKNPLQNIDVESLTLETTPVNPIPHLKFNIETRDTLQKLVTLLNEQKELAPKHSDFLKDQFGQNQMKILLLRTDIELAQLHTQIIKKNLYINDFFRDFKAALVEAKEKFDEVCNELSLVNSEQSNVHLKTYNEIVFEENWEHFVNFYLIGKDIISNDRKGKRPILPMGVVE